MLPQTELYNHLPPGRIPEGVWTELTQAVTACLPAVLTCTAGPVPVLADLQEVEISVVDDAVIKDIHERFLDDPTETDVITFPHGDGLGEIIISMDTAERQAADFGEPIYRELFRYMVHGLLHLHGHIDTNPDDRAVMFSYQEPLVEKFGQKLAQM